MIGILLGLLYFNASEWIAHRYILHGLGKNKKSFYRYHWHAHHQKARRNSFFDSDYDCPAWESPNQIKEISGLALFALAHLPLSFVAPFFTATVCAASANYFRVHRKAHLDPAWARDHLPWHVDHHLGPNQDANWCVTSPFFDWVMGTREPYLGTERESGLRPDLAGPGRPVPRTDQEGNLAGCGQVSR